MRSSLFTRPSRMEVSHVEIKKRPRQRRRREGCKREGERTGGSVTWVRAKEEEDEGGRRLTKAQNDSRRVTQRERGQSISSPAPTLPSSSLASCLSGCHSYFYIYLYIYIFLYIDKIDILTLFCLFITREHLGKYNTKFNTRNIDYTG